MSENEKNEQLDQSTPDVKADKVKKDKAAKTEEKKSKPGIFKRIGKWFKEMRSELKKVQWPGAKTVVRNTIVVIVCVIVVGIFIGIFDTLATSIVQALFRLAGKA